MNNVGMRMLTIAGVCIGAGYLVIICSLAALVLILHDGSATQDVVTNLSQIVWASLSALTIMFTGHTLVNRIAGASTTPPLPPPAAPPSPLAPPAAQGTYSITQGAKP